MKYILSLLFLLVPFRVYSALDCNTVPDCVSLGYSPIDNQDCPDDGWIYCPFDLSYGKCVASSNVDCASIGFTKTPKDAWCSKTVECPNDASYTLCAQGSEVINVCEIGYVFYSDGTCSDAADYNPSTSATPIGVVFYVTDGGAHGKIISLKDITFANKYVFDPANPFNQAKYTTIRWGLKGVDGGFASYDPTGLKSELKNILSNVYDGKRTTEMMAQTTKSDCTDTPNTAAWTGSCVSMPGQAAAAFYPTPSLENDANYGKGKWYIPAIGELAHVYGFASSGVTAGSGNSGSEDNSVKTKVNGALEVLAANDSLVAAILAEDDYWSSTSYTDGTNTYAWKLNMETGSRDKKLKDATLRLRFITEF